MAQEVTTLKVEGMSCQHCVKSVKQAVGALAGVSGVEVDLAAGQVTVNYDGDRVQLTAIREAIEEQGYDVKS
ncbi:copper chaperone [Hydrogenispora ethanolica]|jgi:copper chaperone|uniref:Copper chaperone CopZ n=1 Tax=Hydrogenispora ethanolica TaxID=1082276 RepID=A0A4R1RW63_HYDET|nr:copper chaperone CopZ [Hydrogenispora ethanolica]TCL70923.1 copper chaperone [Hydrogenispora ethanolica]